MTQCQSLSPVQLFTTPWIKDHQAPLSMEFSRQEYWSGLPFPSPGDLPNPWIEPWYPTLQTGSLPSEPPGKPKIGKNSLSVWALQKFIFQLERKACPFKKTTSKTMEMHHSSYEKLYTTTEEALFTGLEEQAKLK